MRNLRPHLPQSTADEVRRNDPCPCGSGRKFKHCCAGKAPANRVAMPSAPTQAADAGLARIAALRDAGRFVEAERMAQGYLRLHPRDHAAHAALGTVHLYASRMTEAVAALAKAVRLAPEIADYHHLMGFALSGAGRDPEAIAALRQAVVLAPALAEAWARLGGLLLTYGRRTEAYDCFRRVGQIDPDGILGRINLASVLLEEGKASQAETLARDTVARFPASIEIKRFLATLLREQGRFGEAIPLLEQATEGSPNDAATAYFDLAMSKRVTGDDRPMLEQMRTLLGYGPLTDTSRQRVQYGLGKALDDLGDYAAAMRHFDDANRLAARNRPFDRAHFGASVERTIISATAEFFAEHAGLGSRSELPVLILGMPRSGTTLVEQIVSSHPEVAGADELQFWHRTAEDIARLGVAGLAPEQLARIADDYLAVLRGIAPTARRVTDKMPGNFLMIGLFHLVFPRGRIIHCRRHPIDTCLSNYFTNFASPMAFTYGKDHLAFYYRCYRRLMEHWRTVLPRGVMLEVDYEDLVSNRDQVTRRMIDFLGVPWDDACLHPEDNQRTIRTASAWQARQPIYRDSTERWRRYEPWLGELRTLLDDPDLAYPVQPVSDSAGLPAARRLRDAGRIDEALSALQQALRATPHDAVLYNEAGTVCLASDRVELAVDCFERAIGLDPNFAVARYNLGAALERQGRGREAIASLRRAIALSPDLGQAYSRLGNLLLGQGEREEALDCFRRAGELLPNPADQELEEAKLLLAEGRLAEAEPKLRKVIALDPGNGLAHAIQGDLLGQLGRFDEAAGLLRKAIELDPNRISAWHNLAMMTKVSDADRSLLDTLQQLLEQPGRTEFDRILLHFALGKAYDDVSDYARAIVHFDAGNALEHRRLPFDREAFAVAIDRTIETFTPRFFGRYAGLGSASEVPLLVLGMPRSGTTLVEQIFSSHGQIAAGGELEFWNGRTVQREDGPSTRDIVPAMVRDYLALLRQLAPDAARVTDKNPFNFAHIGLIHLAFPKARIVHCRRHAIDTCLSIYFTRFASPQPFAYSRADLVFYYRHYERLMAHWRGVLPADRLLEVEYEELTADPERLTRQMIAFSGLEWDDACLRPERNQRAIKTASVWQARQPVYRSSVERWRRYEPWLGELRDLRPEAT